ncbi:MAG: pyruvate kinase [Aeriscardovia sp.]|nr:pyruvate kinase [Aeriscardovia sp.]
MRMGKIVCTIGPACDSVEMLETLMRNGMDVARLNFSHGTPEQHLEILDNIKTARRNVGKNVGIMADFQGPKIRCGWFEKNAEGKDEVLLEKGQDFFITSDDIIGTKEGVSCTYKELPEDVKPGDTLLLNDGLVRLKVKGVDGNKILTQVVVPGRLSSHKGINLPGVEISSPALTEKDEEDLRWALDHDVDMIAMSFVRKAADLDSAKKIMDEKGQILPIIVKMEKPEAIENMEEIVKASQGIMCARGDLAVELPFWQVPVIDKKLVNMSRYYAKPVIMATEMLSSMISNPLPTRAEASDCANAILDGCDCTMTSNETAVGADPGRVVATMAKISQYTSENAHSLIPSVEPREKDGREALAFAALQAAKAREAKAVVVICDSCDPAAATAKFRPSIPIYAFTPSEKAYYQLSLFWGTFAVLDKDLLTPSKEVFFKIDSKLKELGLSKGDRVMVESIQNEGMPGPAGSGADFDHVIS